MSTQHTPGPWNVKHFPDGKGFFVEGNEVAGQVVGREYKREILSDEDYPRKLADAHLTAAGPDMLSALEGVAMVYNMWQALPAKARDAALQKAMQYAHTAIAKARVD